MGEIVHVTPNSAGNCLHSGLHGFNHALFTAEVTRGETDSVTMTAHSPAGTDGFPGNFDLEIQYSLVKGGPDDPLQRHHRCPHRLQHDQPQLL